MKKVFMHFAFLSCFGCALTAPDGKQELLDDIAQDRMRHNHNILNAKSFLGTPNYVKVRQYHVYSDGNIYGKRWVLFQLERPQLDIDKLVEQLKD